jgi:predicted secreted Zn-dependent protease
MIRRPGFSAPTAALAAVAALASCAWGADASSLRAACRNEIALFCAGASSSTLVSCLAEYRGSATASCAAVLKGQATDVRAARAWGSGAASVVASSASAAAAGPRAGFALSVEEKLSTYTVLGARPDELMEEMRSSGLDDSVDGNRGAARTDYSAAYTYGRAPRGKSCALTGAQVALTVTQTYPEWERPAVVAPASEDWWAKELASMHSHEDGHKRLDVALAGEFVRRLKSLAPQPTCADVDKAVKGLYQKLLSEAREQNAAYDRQAAGRGRTQGSQAAARKSGAR